MNPDTVTIERKTEAQNALTAVLDNYPDVFGPLCWCDDHDYCDGPCPSVPATTSRTAWMVLTETMDLDPAGLASTTFHTSIGCGQARAAGMASQAIRFFGGR